MTQLQALLQLRATPIAISFCAQPPAGVQHVSQREPAGCGYWRRAQAGEVFYTDADDHKNCPVGAHTHNVALNPEEQQQLHGLLQTMVGLEYLKMEEVPGIPTRAEPLAVAVYAPLDRAPLSPDVIMVRGAARQLMMLAEAAQAAGVAGSTPAMGRPTCAVIPEAINSARTSASFGCIGNRVYTGLGDEEAYFAIPGSALAAIEDRLQVLVRANRELEKFHRARAQTISS
jgi:uncharacterized protein (DUF169 family)